jgi:hypothetical protein
LPGQGHPEPEVARGADGFPLAFHSDLFVPEVAFERGALGAQSREMVGAGEPRRLVAGQPGGLVNQIKSAFGITETAVYLGQDRQLYDLIADCQLGWLQLRG